MTVKRPLVAPSLLRLDDPRPPLCGSLLAVMRRPLCSGCRARAPKLEDRP